jgi:class 3 adenylate cyclase
LILGLAPVAVLEVARETFHLVTIDSRFAFWSLAFLLLAVARLTLRQELMNARIAVRRAFLYTLAVAVLTFVAILLSAVRPYAVAVLLFPLLYFWPRFDARLNRVLYPKRARFPELVREIGSEMGLAATIEEALDRLVEAPARLCDAESSVAFLLAGVSGSGEVLRARGHSLAAGPAFAEEPLVQLLVATRKEVLHDRVSVEPHYANIREESLAGFDRLGAEIILPILRDSRVVGGLAIGPRSTGDVYESAELDALSTIIQQFVQAMSRIDATDRLRVREREFGDLKRFFPPQIIDQVMARGGAAELRSQRRLVTVLFADLRGFTSFAETVEPEEVMATLAQFHAAMGRRIAECAGTVERFAGDGIMVFFNDPVDQPDHAERAARMALTMQDDIRRLRREWLEKGYRIDVGVGIDTGYATCGFIGYEGRRDYGVIGSVTNLAARLSDVAGPGEVLITARVRGELGPEFSTMAAGELRLKGFAQPQPAWRLSWASETLKAVPTPIRSR